MLDQSFGTVALIAAVALVPGAMRWWWGRSLARHPDDPALPERLMETDRRGSLMFIFAVAAILFLSPLAISWGLPLIVVAQIVGAYPLRKVLFEETWSLPACVWFFVRLLVGSFGFWIVLLMMPIAAVAAGDVDEWLAAALALVLLAWHHWYGDILRLVLRAEPVQDPALLARFTALAQASRAIAPRFEQVRLHGGAMANAVALPSARRPAVLFSETLLARLPADECAAICAHELAHLEYFDRARLRRIGTLNIGLILAGAAILPASRAAGLSSPIVPTVIWLGGFLAMMLVRARDRQRNETASDLRAVELTGDPEALVRALTWLHTFARLPRRFDAQHERHATHPSLARRLRDIRNSAGAAPVRIAGRAAFTGADGRTTVTFDHDRLHWSEGDAVTHSLSYAHLTELRLQAGYSGPTALLAVETGGRRWRMPLAADDVARAQTVLDAVDGHLPDATPPPGDPTALSRGVLALAGLLGLAAGHMAMLFIALMAALQPAAPLLAAAGAGALTAAALLVRDAPFAIESTTGAALLLAGFGAALLGVAIARRREESSRRVILLIAALAVFTTAAVSILLFSGFNPIRLHQSSRAITSATVLLLALGGALACCRVRTLQYASIGVVLAGVGAAAAGSPAFLDRFGDDPFIRPSAPIVWKTVAREPAVEFQAASAVAGLRLSPGGTLVALEPMQYMRVVTEARQFQAGPAGGALTTVAATDLVFTNDRQALLLDARDGWAELRLIEVTPAGPSQIWRLVVNDIFEPALSFDRASGSWRLVGRDRAGRVARAEGRPQFEAVHYTHWPAPDTSHGWIDTIATSGPAALALETRPDPGMLRLNAAAPWMWLLHPHGVQSHVWMIAGSAPVAVAVSRLVVHCADGAMEGRLVCSAFDGTRTRFVALHPGDSRVTPLAWLRGTFTHGSSGNGWMTGWAEATPVALRLATREALRFPPAHGVSHVSASDRVLGTVSYRFGEQPTIRIYSADDLE